MRTPPARRDMDQTRALNVFALTLVALAAGAIASRNLRAVAPISLLNVSYDPTRELYARLNPQFVQSYAKATREQVTIEQAHGGSTRQARFPRSSRWTCSNPLRKR